MAFDPGIVSGPVRATDLITIGKHAAKMVEAVRQAYVGTGVDDDAPEFSSRKTYSQSEIARLCSTSPQTVMRFIAANPEVFPPEDSGTRGKRYSADQYIATRRAIGKAQPAPFRRAITLTFANFKGGCSKSSLCATLATGLALAGRRVLLIDMDPQGTLSAYLGIQPSMDVRVEHTLMPYLINEVDGIDYAIRPTRISNLHIVPAMHKLSMADIEIPQLSRDREYPCPFFRLLDRALEAHRSNYDYIMIDSPPSVSYLTTIACYAADGLLVPLQPAMPDYASSAGFFEQTGELFAGLDKIELPEDQKRYKFLRLVVTRHSMKRGALKVENEIRTTYGGLVLGPVMLESEAVRDAGSAHLTIHEVDSTIIHRETLGRAVESVTAVSDAITEVANRLVQPTESPQWEEA